MTQSQTNIPSTKTLAVFTPTYNRAYILDSLYESLCAQTSSDFCWIIVDDGSTDNTEEHVERYKSENRLEILYIKQENGGKQRAHNTGVDACTSELFFCVDSDDQLTPTAIEEILDLWSLYSADSDVAGIIALRGRSEEQPLGTWMPTGIELTTMWDLYYKYHHTGDTALVYRTEILKHYPYDVAPDEKFIAETYVYHQIDQIYKLAVLNKVVWLCEYLPDGYTKNVRKVTRENPVSYMKHKLLMYKYSHTLRLKFENAILYFVGAHFAHCTGKAFGAFPNKLLALIAIPAAYVLSVTEFKK